MTDLRRLVRDLHRSHARERRGLLLAEGVRLVEEALATGQRFEGALVDPALRRTARGAALAQALAGHTSVLELGDRELEQLALTDQPQGVIAVLARPDWLLDRLDLEGRAVVLVLDGVQDPGNAGTLLRTAHGLGARGVLALPGTVELTNPKVVRGSMGALFRIPSLHLPLDAFTAWAARHRVRVLVGETGAPLPAPAAPSSPTALVVGNEGAGISPALRNIGTPVGIPLVSGAESLNVAVAAGILLHEVLRD